MIGVALAVLAAAAAFSVLPLLAGRLAAWLVTKAGSSRDRGTPPRR